MNPASYKNFSRIISVASKHGEFDKAKYAYLMDYYIFDNLKGRTTFSAKCLSGALTAENPANPPVAQNSLYPIKLRPTFFTDLIDDPCSEKFAKDDMGAKMAISLHPAAIGMGPLGAGQRTPGFGEDIQIEFLCNSPDQFGKMRCMRYHYPMASVQYDHPCANEMLKSMVGKFAAYGSPLLMGGMMPAPGAGGGTAAGMYLGNQDLSVPCQKGIGNWTGADRSRGNARRRIYVGKIPEWTDKMVFNGQLPDEIMCKTNVTKKGTVLLREIMPYFEEFAMAFKEHFGNTLHASGFRTYDRQVKLKIQKPRLAARAGTSNHGWGLAFDWNAKHHGRKGQAGTKQSHGFKTDSYRWMDSNASKYNFHNPGWARSTGSKPEWWHFEWINTKQFLVKKRKKK